MPARNQEEADERALTMLSRRCFANENADEESSGSRSFRLGREDSKRVAHRWL